MELEALLSEALRDVEPMLKASGRGIRLVSTTNDGCVVELSGFCSGCACGDSYMEGIEEIIRERAPSIQRVEFILN